MAPPTAKLGERPPWVLVYMSPASAFCRNVAAGVSEYSHRNDSWELGLLEPSERPRLSPLKNLSGVIASGQSDAVRRYLRRFYDRTGIPVVLTADSDDYDLPRVAPNDAIVGRMALETFRDRGFRHVAFTGPWQPTASTLRREAFCREAQRAGLKVSVFQGNSPVYLEPVTKAHRDLRRWLVGLAKPVGLLVFCDSRALTVLHLCREADISVPEEIAVLGVDNDTLLCEMTHPRLSSIDHGARRIGYEAAALLDDLMHGREVPKPPVLVDPIGVVERHSTDTMAIEDPEIVRERAGEGIDVRDVLQAAALSRRALERGFRRTLGRTVYQEILRVRVEMAKHLLLRTDMPLTHVSNRCGFSYRTKMSEVFKRLTGLTPRQYRRKFYVGGDRH